MNWKNTEEGSDERAVSPVIGVIMMVAVTVILAAVVSMLVLGMGSDVDSNPQATFSFDHDGTNATITHEGGDTLDAGNVVIIHDGGETDWTSTDGEVTAGDSNSVSAGAGTTVKVVWEGDNGDTATLATYEVPT